MISLRVKTILLFFIITLSPQLAIAYPGCTLYQHRDYGGSAYFLESGGTLRMVHRPSGPCNEIDCHQIHYAPAWNDQISSFRLDFKCELLMWEHINKGGEMLKTRNNYKYVGGRWNDKATEAMCNCYVD